MTTQTQNDVKAALLATAADVGIKMRAEQATLDSKVSAAKTAKGAASDAVRDLDRAAKGYTTPQFVGLAALGDAFATGGVNDPEGEFGVEVSQAMTLGYLASFTATTAKTKAGGTEAGIAKVIRLGANAKRLLGAFQSRLDHWTKIRDSASESEDAAEAKAQREQADTFLVLADSAKTDDKGALIRPAKWRGRPATVVRGVAISAAGATNRRALLAYAATLYAQHGDEILHPDVIDAILCNGGKADKPQPGVAETATKAAEMVQKLLVEFHGESTADRVFLESFQVTLERIAQHGFKANVVAESSSSGEAEAEAKPAPVVNQPPPLPVAEAVATLPEATDEPETSEADVVLDGDDAETTMEAILARNAARNAANGVNLTPPPLPGTPEAEAAKPDPKAARSGRTPRTIPTPPKAPARVNRRGGVL